MQTQVVDAKVSRTLALGAVIPSVQPLDAWLAKLLALDAIILATSEETVSSVIKLVWADTRPRPRFFVKDENGVAVDITGATPRFHLRQKGKTALIFTKLCTVISGPGGECEPQWAAADWGAGANQIPQPALDIVDEYKAELEVTFSDATVGTTFGLYDVLVRRNVG